MSNEEENKKCEWALDEDVDGEFYNTDCGNYVTSITNEPQMFKFCPWCGADKKIIGRIEGTDVVPLDTLKKEKAYE